MTRTWEPMDPRTKLTRKQIAALFLAQDGRCVLCGQKLQTKGHTPVEFIDEHMIPRWAGGPESQENRALVCKPCAKDKTAAEAPVRAKGLRARDKFIGAKVRKGPPMPGTRASQWKQKLNGEWERR